MLDKISLFFEESEKDLKEDIKELDSELKALKTKLGQSKKEKLSLLKSLFKTTPEEYQEQIRVIQEQIKNRKDRIENLKAASKQKKNQKKTKFKSAYVKNHLLQHKNKYISILVSILLIGCIFLINQKISDINPYFCPKSKINQEGNDITLNCVEITNNKETGNDILRYTAFNPTETKKDCTITMAPKGLTSITEKQHTFSLEPQEAIKKYQIIEFTQNEQSYTIKKECN